MLFVLRFLLAFTVLALLPSAGVRAQGEPPSEDDQPLIRFNGLGRSVIQQTGIGGTLLNTDSLTVENLTDGEFLLDLAVTAQPNDATEVQGVIRMRNEFGGFFGSGVTVEVRELWARGVIADVVRYRVGDMNLALTPYTLFLPEEDGVVNEPEIFRPQKEVIYYEEFYTGFNERRLQGASLDFGLEFDRVLNTVDVKGFVARLRTTDFTNTPNRFIGGGRVGVTSPQIGQLRTQGRIGANLAYTWDDLGSGRANTGIRNSVVTIDANMTVLDRKSMILQVLGEGGRSMVALKTEEESGDRTETLFDESDTFVEFGVSATLRKSRLGLAAMFVDVGPDFYSSAAQSKPVDYTRSKSFFNRIGNDRELRRVTLFDLSRDPSLYTSRIANELMTYDPRYSNVLPYGRATPNRRGIRLGGTYAPPEVPVDATVDVAVLREIRGQGTTRLKHFFLVRAAANVEANALVPGWRRPLDLTLGLQYESTNRSGEPVEQVDLTSTLFEAGLTAEIYDRVDVLLGAKLRVSNGRDYVPQIVTFNEVRDFPAPFLTDDRESLIGAGLRYRFKDGVYLTVQYQRFDYSADATPTDDYRLGQVFALYSMSF